MALFQTVFIVLVLPYCSAIDKARLFQSQIEWNQGQLLQNAASLQHTLAKHNVTVPNNGCPVCNDDDDRFIQTVLQRSRGLIRRSSTFPRFKRFVRTKLGRRRYNAKVSAETLVPLLTASSSHFSAFGSIAHKLNAEAMSGDAFKVELVELLEQVSNSNAILLTNLTHLLQRSNATTAGMVTMSILSILELYERFTLATLSTVADYLLVLTGRTNSGLDEKVHALRDTLPNGIFSPLLGVLHATGDSSGLTAVLFEATTSIADIVRRLDRFKADDATTENGKYDTSLQSMAGIINVMVGIMATTVSSMNRIVLNLHGLGVMLGSVLGLIVVRLDGILSQFVTTLSSTMELLVSDRNDTVSGDILVFALCVYLTDLLVTDPGTTEAVRCYLIGLIPLVVVTSPIWVPILVIWLVVYTIKLPDEPAPGLAPVMSPVMSPVVAPTLPFSCQWEALECQNNALSAVLPSL